MKTPIPSKNQLSKCLKVIIAASMFSLIGCNGSGSNAVQQPDQAQDTQEQSISPSPFNFTSIEPLEGKPKALKLTWGVSEGATEYALCKDVNGQCMGLATVSEKTEHGMDVTQTFMDESDEYFVVAKNSTYKTEMTSNRLSLSADEYKKAIGYFKASNGDSLDFFGGALDISHNGKVMVISSAGEQSNSQSDPTNNSVPTSGAVYVFKHENEDWSQSHYLKSSDAALGKSFGDMVAISDDGQVIAALSEDKLFIFEGAVEKANFPIVTRFTQAAMALSGDGKTVFVIGANRESVDVYERSEHSGTWSKSSSISNPSGEIGDSFAWSLATNRDGTKVVIGVTGDDSNSTGVNRDHLNNLKEDSGAVYVFQKQGSSWQQQAYIKPNYLPAGVEFGYEVYIHPTKDFILVRVDDSSGVIGDPTDTSLDYAGAVYLFGPHPTNGYEQLAYIKSPTPKQYSWFGHALGMNEAANLIAIGEPLSDAVHQYELTDTNTVRFKKSMLNPRGRSGDFYGGELKFSQTSLLVGASWDSSNSRTIQQGREDTSSANVGAAYLH